MNELILVQNQTQTTGRVTSIVQRISSDFILFSKLRRLSHSSSNLSDSRCTCCRNTFNSSAISASVGSDNFYNNRFNLKILFLLKYLVIEARSCGWYWLWCCRWLNYWWLCLGVCWMLGWRYRRRKWRRRIDSIKWFWFSNWRSRLKIKLFLQNHMGPIQ